MKLRDYQEKAVEKVLECWKTFRSCLIVLPTGCGKTVVFGEIIRRALESQHQPSANHAMILAHREELITQARDKVEKLSGAEAQIEMGTFEVTPMFGRMPPVVVSTVQTQCAPSGRKVKVEGEGEQRMAKFCPDDFSVLVIDEAHHATAKSYRTCIEHYLSNPKCRLLGVTATPDRADESALGQVFDTVAYELTVTEAIEQGWLVPVRQRLVKVNALDFSKVSTCAGDFNQGELAQVLEEEHNLHAVAAPTIEICGNRRAIVFATSVKQAERICEIINRTEGKTAAWVCGKTEKEERRQILDDFKRGKIQFVVNVGVLTEGFDDAGVEVVVMARPTKSRALYAQMAGRATRPAAEIADRLGEVDGCSLMVDGSCQPTNNQQPATNNRQADAAAARRALIAGSNKPSCLIIDFVGNSGRHKLVSTADILGGKSADEDETAARERAKKRCEESGADTDMIEEVRKAREEIKAEKAEAAKRRSFIQATAKFIEVSVDPFNIFDIPPVETSVPSSLGRNLSWKQKELLREKLKVNPDGIGTGRARLLLDEYFRRINGHLATFGQMKALRKFGIPVPMKFDEASRTLTRLFK